MTDSVLSKMARAIARAHLSTKLGMQDEDELVVLVEGEWEQWLPEAQAALDASGVREVLEPFARVAKAYLEDYPGRPDGQFAFALANEGVTQGDLRRARDFLTALSPRLRGVFTLNDDHADNRMLTALEDAATFGDLRLLLFERQRFMKALEEIATRLEMADLSVEGTEFQGYSRAMFRLPAIATLARKALSPTPGRDHE